MNALLDFSSNYREYIKYIIIGFCVLGILIAISVILMISILDAKKKPLLNHKNADVSKTRHIRDLKEAFEIMHEEKFPFFSDIAASFLSELGIIKNGPIISSFFKIMRILKKATFDKNWRYKLPWYLVIGPLGSGKTSLLNGLSFMPLAGSDKSHNEVWHLFDTGVLFEVPSNIFLNESSNFWEFFAKTFAYFRPRRPLDGIVLTLPADMLNHKKGEELTKLARETVYKISSLQNIINFRLPIYIVITKSDRIPGFSEFCAEMSTSEKGQIIGWSSSDKMDSGFQRNWLEEALEVISTGLRKASLAFSKSKKISVTLENVIFIKSGINSIIKDLNLYISALTKKTDRDLFLCVRGIYFTARNNEKVSDIPIVKADALRVDNIENQTSSISDVTHYNICFADDLFREKIFKECNLAHPINLSMLDVSRETWIKRCLMISFSIAYTLGWYISNEKICNEIKSAEGILKSAVSLMRRINVIEDDIRDHTDQEILKQETKKMLQIISGINKNNLFSWVVPASWVSRIPSKISSTVGLMFDSSTTKAVFLDLSLNAKMAGIATSTQKQNKNTKKNNPFDVSSTNAFIEFKNYINRIIKLEKMEIEYNRIRKLDDPSAIDFITKDMFKETFDVTNILQDRTPNSRFVAPQFHLDQFQDEIRKNTFAIFSRFLNEIFNDTIEKIFEKLCEDIERFHFVSQHPKEEYSSEELSKLYGKIETILAIIDSDKFNWIREQSFIPSDDYSVVFSNIEISKILGHEISKELLQIAEQKFRQLKEKLKNFSTVFTGQLFSKSFKASEDFIAFKKELSNIISEPFIVKTIPKGFISTIPSDQLLFWDAKIIKDATNLIERFDDFCVSKLKTMRSQFQQVYQTIIRKSMYPSIVSILARAQILEDAPNGATTIQIENALKKHAVNLSELLQQLSRLIPFLDAQANSGSGDCGFVNLIITESMSMLSSINYLFEVESPYSVGNNVFSDWNGTTSPSFAGSNDPNEVKKYLSAQYTRMKFLARELATPVINLLSSEHIAKRINYSNHLEKWKEIVAQVEEFDISKPGNSISALETFISGIVSGTSLKTIKDDTSISEISRQNGDYFINQRSKIAKALVDRASNINIQNAYNAYSTLSNYFNTNIAGRFPFGSSIPNDASITSLESMINMYESLDVNVLDVLKKYAIEKNVPNDVLEFLTNLVTSFDFIKAWIEHSKNSDPQNALVGFQIETRVNKENEMLGNIISERNIIVNGLSQDTDNAIIVYNGDSVEVEVPFVLSGSGVEIDNANISTMHVLGEKVIFSYNGNWAMINLIENHRINKSSSSGGIILGFSIPVIMTASENSAQAKVFMRVTPVKRVPGGPWVPVQIPHFPDRAPTLSAGNF